MLSVVAEAPLLVAAAPLPAAAAPDKKRRYSRSTRTAEAVKTGVAASALREDKEENSAEQKPLVDEAPVLKGGSMMGDFFYNFVGLPRLFLLRALKRLVA